MLGEILSARFDERLNERTCRMIGKRLGDWKYASRMNKNLLNYSIILSANPNMLQSVAASES